MKKARLDKNGKILELFEGDLSKKLNSEIIKKLVNVPDQAKINGYFISNELFEPAPSDDYQLIGGRWQIKPEASNQETKNQERALARERLKEIGSSNSIAALRARVEDLIKILDIEL